MNWFKPHTGRPYFISEKGSGLGGHGLLSSISVMGFITSFRITEKRLLPSVPSMTPNWFLIHSKREGCHFCWELPNLLAQWRQICCRSMPLSPTRSEAEHVAPLTTCTNVCPGRRGGCTTTLLNCCFSSGLWLTYHSVSEMCIIYLYQ